MLTIYLKKIIEKIPEPLGRVLTKVPFGVRFGFPYVLSRHEIKKHDSLSLECKEKKLYNRLKVLLEYSYHNIPFYKRHYESHSYHPGSFKTLADFSIVPMVTKADFQAYNIDDRYRYRMGVMKINTGGTSGAPLHFFVDRNAFAREWAHMHEIWMSKGYKTNHLKLTFRGKNLGKSNILQYNPIHNEYVVNSYVSMGEISLAVSRLIQKKRVLWVHGYPSLVSEFASHINQFHPALALKLKKMLMGILLGSEYPAPMYRNIIRDVLSDNIVSWYGHSEMAMLAYEVEEGIYQNMPTYGYAEAVREDSASTESRLIATSLHNMVHPFIRYDTGDLVKEFGFENGNLLFGIEQGRIGDFIVDREGKKIFLTALIFGRHHAAFEKIAHVQVLQVEKGRATLVIVLKGGDLAQRFSFTDFDLNDVNVDWDLKIVPSPIRTVSGKIRLKIDSSYDTRYINY